MRKQPIYGGNEGIYLDLWIWFYEDGKRQYHQLGTYKTLREDAEGMHKMAALLADFIVIFQKYINSRLDDFTWQGADVHAIDENGKQITPAVSCQIKMVSYLMMVSAILYWAAFL